MRYNYRTGPTDMRVAISAKLISCKVLPRCLLASTALETAVSQSIIGGDDRNLTNHVMQRSAGAPASALDAEATNRGLFSVSYHSAGERHRCDRQLTSFTLMFLSRLSTLHQSFMDVNSLI
jgi:hypothetical protein